MNRIRLLRLFVPAALVSLAACAAPGAAAPHGGEPASEAHAQVAPADPGAMTGVGYAGPGIETPAPKVIVKEVNPFQPITIHVVGNGAPPYSNALTPSQRKLLAMRAARLDAFRAIAEQVQGMKLIGSSSVANMIATSDGFRTYVDAYLRGVRIVSTTLLPDGTSEAVAEIVLDQAFYQQFRMALQRTGSVMQAAQESPAIGLECGDGNCANSRYQSHYYVAQ